jgi:hypothetical protein
MSCGIIGFNQAGRCRLVAEMARWPSGKEVMHQESCCSWVSASSPSKDVCIAAREERERGKKR